MRSYVDHIVYATPDLAAGVVIIERLLRCDIVPGGRHPGWGTRNALVSLGTASYLEIIGPDPDTAAGTNPTLFGIDRLDAPRIVTWAVKGHDLTDLVASAKEMGVDLGSVSAGSRSLPDGSQLAWELTDPFAERCGGVVPFFIDWGAGPHPATTLPRACTLVAVTIEHPDVERVETALEAVGVTAPVTKASQAAVTAVIETPNGVVELSR